MRWCRKRRKRPVKSGFIIGKNICLQSVLDAFKEKSGYSVEQVYYEADELKEDLLQATQGEGLDLVIGSGQLYRVRSRATC